MSAASGGVPLARRFGPAGCNLTMPPPNSAIHNESTHGAKYPTLQ